MSLINPAFVAPWLFLGDWFRGSEPTAFEQAYGMAFWEYHNQNPELNHLFNEAMACDSQMPSYLSFWQLIFHGWSDEDCLKILKKCKEAISSKEKGGKVIIVDVVIDEKKDEKELTETKLLFDMLMMVVAAGKERSVPD
ncbi:O-METHYLTRANSFERASE [Salix viminalis]|uniref:O-METHYLTRANSFERASE n=1 Tax=Salix viminalis TaxID=40686 RepID=A0A9Q0S9V7_SALVM|nr:O-METHYLTRANSFERASE [Salix viminalis]